MSNIKTFLESSTIHGLAYITSTRKLTSIFWILVVIAGFTGAGVLIYQAFQDWADSPVKTTIETEPITKITFPTITVCPPKNTYTDLNYDLVTIKNITINNNTRKELKNYAYELIQDHFHKIIMTNLAKLSESNRYYNRLTAIIIPHLTHKPNSDSTYLSFKVKSYAMTGCISTQNFGKPLKDELSFGMQYKGEYDWYEYREELVNLKLHKKIKRPSDDTSLTSLPYFGVKLSCVCLMFADRKKIAYSYLKVT